MTMKTLLILGFIGTLVAAGAASYNPIAKYLHERNKPVWKLVEVDRGPIVAVRNSTGEVKPVQSIIIGSFVSGPISEINVDFNDEVKVGDILAKVDPRLFEASQRSAVAALNSRLAEVQRVKAQLEQARRDEKRALDLQKENQDYISQTEIDQYVYSVDSFEAQLDLALAAVEQAQAALDNANANVAYTDIRAPMDGVIIDRKIDPGQTLAASFQAPELFVLAPDMEKKIHVFASVDEADIGHVMKAKEAAMPVQFTVDAWPGEVFDGEIEQIRVSSIAAQTVVTYPVVIAAANPERKLLPGMTATITFEVDRRDDALRLPTKALRYLPQDRNLVREEDHDILEGRRTAKEDNSEDVLLSAAETAAAKRRHKTRHIWVVEGEKLKAVEIETGIDDHKFTEILSGDLQSGDKVVAGVMSKGSSGK